MDWNIEDSTKLKEGLQRRDHDAVQALYNALTHGSVHNYVRYKTKRWHCYEDVEHDVFVKLLTQFQNNPPNPQFLKSYLFVALPRIIKRSLKKYKSTFYDKATYRINYVTFANYESIERALDRKALMPRLRSVITTMPRLQRTILERYLEGQTEEQMKMDLGLANHRFQVLKNRAKQRVCSRLWN